MAKKNTEPVLFTVSFDTTQLKQQSKEIADLVAKGVSDAFAGSVKKLGEKIGKSINVVIGDSLLKTLEKPIKLTVNTTDAKKSINDLVAPLKNVLGNITEAGAVPSKSTKKLSNTKGQTEKKSLKAGISGLEAEFSVDGKINVNDEIDKLKKLKKEYARFIEEINDNPADQNLTRSQLKRLEDLKEKQLAIEKSYQAKLLQNQLDTNEALFRKDKLEQEKLQKQREKFQKESDEKAKLRQAKSIVSTNLRENFKGLEKELEKAKSSLQTFGLDDKNTNSLTKNLSKAIDTVKSKVATLQQELKKPKPDLIEIDKLLGQIADAKADVNNRKLEILGDPTKNISSANFKKQAQQLLDAQVSSTPATPAISFNPLAIAGTEVKIKNLTAALQAQRDVASSLGIPLSEATKRTRGYDSAIERLNVDLIDIQQQFQSGNITLEEAEKRFVRLAASLNKTQIGINEINPAKLSNIFANEQADNFFKNLPERLGIFAFTLQSVGGRLTQFGQQAFQTFQQLATLGAPIEKAQTIIAQKFEGIFSAEQQKEVVNRLEALADLPGSNLKDTSDQFLRFQDALGGFNSALKITQGLINLSAKTGVDKSNEITQILLDAVSKDKGFNQDSFGKLQSLGGENVQRVLKEAGVTSTFEANTFGVRRTIRLLSEELSKLKPPLLTTADRFSILENRIAKIAAGFGKILSPGLDRLNAVLLSIGQTVEELSNSYNKLSAETKDFVGTFAVAVPILTTIAGILITITGFIGFVLSGLAQVGAFISAIVIKITGASTAFAGIGAIFTAIGDYAAAIGVTVGGVLATIAIVIGAVTAAVVALATNFNGVADRLYASFANLFGEISALVNEIFTPEVLEFLAWVGGGLLVALQYIGSFLLGLVKTVGLVLVDAFNALLSVITTIIRGIKEIVQGIKNGDILQAVYGLLKTIYGLTVAIFVNLGSLIAASILDGIATGLESTGFKDLATKTREAASSVRSVTNSAPLNDKGVALTEKEIEAKKQLAEQEKKSNEEKEKEADLLKEKEEQITKLNNILKENAVRAKEAFEANKYKLLNDELKESINNYQTLNDLISSQFREQIDKTDNLNKVTTNYNDTVGKLKRNQAEINSLREKESLNAVKTSIFASVQGEESLKAIQEAIKNGVGVSADQRNSLGLIDKVLVSQDIGEITSILTTLENTAPKLLSAQLKNLVSAARLEASRISKETNTANNNFQKQLNDERKAFEQRRVQIKVENIEREAKEKLVARQIERENKLAEIERRTDLIGRQREIEKVRLSTSQERLSLEAKISEFSEGQLADLERQKEIANQKFDFEKEIIDLQKQIDVASIRAAEMGDLQIQLQAAKERLAVEVDISGQKQARKEILDIEKEITLARNKVKEVENLKEQLGLVKDRQKIERDFSKSKFDLEGLIRFKNALKEIQDITRNIGATIVSKINDVLKPLFEGTGLQTFTAKIVELTGTGLDLGGLRAFQRRVEGIKSSSKDAAEELRLLRDEFIRTATLDARNVATESQTKLRTAIRNSKAEGLLDGPRTSLFYSNLPFILSNIAIEGGVNRDAQGDIVSRKAGTEDTRDPIADLRDKLKKFITRDADRKKEFDIFSASKRPEDFEPNEKLNFLIDNFLPSILQNKVTSENFFAEVFPNVDEKRKQDLVEIIKLFIEYKESLRQIKVAEKERGDTFDFTAIDSTQANELKATQTRIEDVEFEASTLRATQDTLTGKELLQNLDRQRQIKAQIEVFNADKLDIEAKYNAYRESLVAKDDENELKRIDLKYSQERKTIQDNLNKTLTTLGYTREQLVIVPQPTLVGAAGTPAAKAADNANKTEPESKATDPISGKIAKNTDIVNKFKDIIITVDSLKNSFIEVGDQALNAFEKIVSGQKVIDSFKAGIGGMQFGLKELGNTFKEVGIFAIGAFGDALGKALVDSLVNGESFLKSLRKFFGDMLVALGSQLVSLGAASLAFAALAFFFTGLVPPQWALGVGAATAALATGVGLIAAGRLIGGSGSSSVANTSSSNATNSANSTSNSGQVDYDVNKDPKLQYQRALQQQVIIEVRTDDTNLVKKFIKTVNRDSRLSNLLDNRRSGFVL